LGIPQFRQMLVEPKGLAGRNVGFLGSYASLATLAGAETGAFPERFAARNNVSRLSEAG
jgi:hypothetical protein